MKTALATALAVVTVVGTTWAQAHGQAHGPAHGQGQMFQTVPHEDAELLQTGPGKLYCPSCGMNLVKFYRTSHAVRPKTGPATQYCSMRCLVETHEEIPQETLVVNVHGLKFIPAATAAYVVGSSKPGTMTMNSKYAFGGMYGAEAFVKANGGEIKSFVEAVAIARKGWAQENMMIGKKRSAKARKGQAMFEKLSTKTDLPRFSSIAEAKIYVAESGICGSLKDDQYHAIAIYLFTRGGRTVAAAALTPAKDSKCPVCGMFVAPYPGWLAMIETTTGDKFYFDGVKDMMKFYFSPKTFKVDLDSADCVAFSVSDYYTLGIIKADEAWFVMGSNIFGPMGHELIPFMTEADATTFKTDHFGKKVLSFASVTESLVHELDQ